MEYVIQLSYIWSSNAYLEETVEVRRFNEVVEIFRRNI